MITLQHKEEGQMQREAREESREMVTFSREQQCIDATVAAASPPPSPFCIPLSLPIPILFSSVQDDRDEKLAVDQNNSPYSLLSSTHDLSIPHLLYLSHLLLL